MLLGLQNQPCKHKKLLFLSVHYHNLVTTYVFIPAEHNDSYVCTTVELNDDSSAISRNRILQS